MSNMIKNGKGQEVFTNVFGNEIIIGENSFAFSELLPVIEHYMRGGIFGHARTRPGLDGFSKALHDALKLTEENEAFILSFIERVKTLNPYLIKSEQGKNLIFLSKKEAKGFKNVTLLRKRKRKLCKRN